MLNPELSSALVDKAKEMKRRLAKIDHERELIKLAADQTEQMLIDATNAEIKTNELLLAQTQKSISKLKNDITEIKAKMASNKTLFETAQAEQTQQSVQLLKQYQNTQPLNNGSHRTTLENQEFWFSSLWALTAFISTSAPTSTEATLTPLQQIENLQQKNKQLCTRLQALESSLSILEQQEKNLKKAIDQLKHKDYKTYFHSKNPEFNGFLRESVEALPTSLSTETVEKTEDDDYLNIVPAPKIVD